MNFKTNISNAIDDKIDMQLAKCKELEMQWQSYKQSELDLFKRMQTVKNYITEIAEQEQAYRLNPSRDNLQKLNELKAKNEPFENAKIEHGIMASTVRNAKIDYDFEIKRLHSFFSEKEQGEARLKSSPQRNIPQPLHYSQITDYDMAKTFAL